MTTAERQPVPPELAAILEPIKAQIAPLVQLARVAVAAYYAGQGLRDVTVDLDAMTVELPPGAGPAVTPTPEDATRRRDP